MMSLPFWKLSPMFLPRGFLSGGQVRIGGLCQDGGSLSGSGGDICQEGGLCQERSPCAVDERAVCNDLPLCVMWIEKKMSKNLKVYFDFRFRVVRSELYCEAYLILMPKS